MSIPAAGSIAQTFGSNVMEALGIRTVHVGRAGATAPAGAGTAPCSPDHAIC